MRFAALVQRFVERYAHAARGLATWLTARDAAHGGRAKLPVLPPANAKLSAPFGPPWNGYFSSWSATASAQLKVLLQSTLPRPNH